MHAATRKLVVTSGGNRIEASHLRTCIHLGAQTLRHTRLRERGFTGMVVLCTATIISPIEYPQPNDIWRVLPKAGIAELHADLTAAWLAWQSRDVEFGM